MGIHKRRLEWLAILMALAGVNLAREAIVRVCGIQQELVFHISRSDQLFLAEIGKVEYAIFALFGSAVVLFAGWMLFGGRDTESSQAARNMRWGTVIGFVLMSVINVEPCVATWTWSVAVFALLCGCLMGARVIGRSGLYGGFGVIYGAALFYVIGYGFGVSGALLLTASFAGSILWFPGFILGRVRKIA